LAVERTFNWIWSTTPVYACPSLTHLGVAPARERVGEHVVVAAVILEHRRILAGVLEDRVCQADARGRGIETHTHAN